MSLRFDFFLEDTNSEAAPSDAQRRSRLSYLKFAFTRYLRRWRQIVE